MLKKMLLSAALFFLFVTLPITAHAYTPNITGMVINNKASGQNTVNLKKAISSNKYKLIIVNFWATWCPPCRAEIPELERAYSRYKAKGLDIIGVNVNAVPYGVEGFLSDRNVTYPVVSATQGEVVDYGGISEIPQSFFIVKGHIVLHWQGEVSRAMLDEVLRKAGIK